MFNFRSTALRFQVRGFELKVPFGRAIRVINQHQVWIVFQPFRLQFHGSAVLLYEFRENIFQQPGYKRNPAKEIPRGDYIDAAVAARDWRDGGKAGEPVLPGANGFRANVGEPEIDGGGNRVGIGIETQKLVGRRV